MSLRLRDYIRLSREDGFNAVTVSSEELEALLDVAEAAPEATRLLEVAQEEGLSSCRQSMSWENAEQHDAMCKVRKAASRLGAALARLREVTQ